MAMLNGVDQMRFSDADVEAEDEGVNTHYDTTGCCSCKKEGARARRDTCELLGA